MTTTTISVFQHRETGEIINPRSPDFVLSPWEVVDGAETWEDVFASPQEIDYIDGFSVIQIPTITTRTTIDNNDQRTVTIFHAPYAIGGYRTFLVWEPSRSQWALDVALIDGKAYHCHPAVSGKDLDGFRDSNGYPLTELIFGEERPGVTISPVRWAEYIDFQRWCNPHMPEFVNVEIVQPGR